MKRFSLLSSLFLSIVPCLFILLVAQEASRIHQEAAVQWRVVPVYAFDRQWNPAADLADSDIEVYVDRKRVDSFHLVKKEPRLAGVRQNVVEGKNATFVPRRKLVFLIFDSSLTLGYQMRRAKKIVMAMLAQPDDNSQYIVMTIEPFGGLTHVIGPDAGREAVARAIRRVVSGKKSEFLGNKSLGADIRDTGPSRSVFGYDSPGVLTDRFTSEAKIFDKNESFDNRRITSAFQSSLEPLTAIFGAFQERGKVVFLFSSGIPLRVFGQKTEYQIEDNKLENILPDDFYYKGIQTLASIFKRNGVLLFLVNPGGTRIKSDDPESGEKSLRMIADDSGGRYYSGTEKEITSEVLLMERAYYEVLFPFNSEVKNPEIDFKIVSKRPDVTVYSVKYLARAKKYSEMSRMEREVLIIDTVRSGDHSRVELKIIPFVLGGAAKAGSLSVFPVRIPAELAGSEWDLYRVWTGKTSGDVKMELDRLIPRTTDITVEVKARKGYRRYALLVHLGTGTALVGSE